MFSLPTSLTSKPNHRLDANKIVETAQNIAGDINQRLPGTTLGGLAEELASLAVATEARGARANRPLLAVRALSFVAISVVLLGLWFLVKHIHARWEFGSIAEVFDGLDAGFNLLVLLAGALWFCATLESRIKRKEVLGYIEELREFIHVIDVTQLYYTPNLYQYRQSTQVTNVAIDETYLLHCTQMLAVISNLAALYSRGATADSILRAVSEVEILANAISTKQLTKVVVARNAAKDNSVASPQSTAAKSGLAPT